MARPVSGKIMEDIIWEKQRNGSYYCYQRERIWEDGKTKNIKKKLLGKSATKGGELEPTRGKRPSAASSSSKPLPAESKVKASRMHIGMMDIINHIGKVSGIDEDLYSITDRPTAEKIISVARYIVGTDGQTFPSIEEWMLTHPVPYVYPITEDVYLNLFHDIGLDESLRQSFFKCRIEREPDLVLLVAYDSSTENSESKNPEARLGMNKDYNGKRSIKILVLYSLRTRRPLAFIKQPANVPDIIAIQDALSQLKALGAKNVALITDNGFTSDDNLGAILHANQHSLTRVKISRVWVKNEIDNHEHELQFASNIMPYDLNVKGVTIKIKRRFSYIRVYKNAKKSLKAGERDYFQKTVYLHLYRDASRKEKEDKDFMSEIIDVEGLILRGEALSDNAEQIKNNYLITINNGKIITVHRNNKAINEACKNNGVFALVSDYFKDANEALELYRKREWIEDYYERMKQNADGDTSRTGNPDKSYGRLFVQFVAMSYIEELQELLRKMKKSLGKPNGDPKHDTKANLDNEDNVKKWLKHRSLYRVLTWFDAHDTFEVSENIKKTRWNTDVIARDNLFLKLLGM